jgi:hypothetical protein
MKEKRQEPNNLTDAQKDITVSPEEEASLLSSLKAEGASFVPDKLAGIMRKAGVEQTAVSAKDEADILSAVKKEGSSFVPNDLLAIQKATGTVPVPADQESLAIHEKVKNEGDEIVKNAEPAVFAKTGVRRRWSFGASFKAHKLSWIGGFATGAAAIALAVSLSVINNKSQATLAYVSVSVESASSYNNNSTSGLSLLASGTSATVNSYTPSFSFVTDGKNIAKANTLSANNYSATLVKAKIASVTDVAAPSLIAEKLLPPSYDLGYLETKEKNLPNSITITIHSDNASFAGKYQSSYKDAINKYLTANKIYAEVTFKAEEDSSLSSYTNELSSEKAAKVLKAYGFISNDGADTTNKEVYLAALAKEDDDILDELLNAFSATASSALSDEAMSSVHDGISLAYLRYINGYKLDFSENTSSLQAALAMRAYLLPWESRQHSFNPSEYMDDNAYYINSNPSWESLAVGYVAGMANHIDNTQKALSVYYRIRDQIMASSNTQDSFKSLLYGVAERATNFRDRGAFPDDRDYDDGRHDHGEPGGDWGPGGGDWHEGEDDW